MDVAYPDLAPATPAHADTWYAASANASPARSALRGETRVDICVIGAGFTGLSAALELAERGLSVVVLEAARVGWGASGRNGGQIVNGYSRDLATIARRYGETAMRGLAAMSLEGGAIIRERVARYGIDCALKPGNLITALNARQMRELDHTRRDWEAHGHPDLEIVDRRGLAAHVTTDRYVGGLLDRQGGHLHPLNLALGEAAAFESIGGRIHEASPAIAIDAGPNLVVRTEAGAVHSRTVLVCGNAYLGPLLRHELGRHIMPVSTQIIATEPLGERVRALLPSDVCVEDANYILDYYRRTADDRLLYGGGVVYGGRDPVSIERRILPALHRTFPSLAGVRVDYAWSGNFALTLTRIPHVGRLSPGLYFSHGDSGHGVTTTHLLGRLLAEAVVATEGGQAARFDLFAGLRPLPFPGGQALRVPLAVLGSWYYRMRDRFG